MPKRRISTLPLKILTFGCLAPTVNMKLFWDQLHAAHRYYNTLVEIELNRRAVYRKLRSGRSPELQELEAEKRDIEQSIETLREAIGKVRQEKRKRTDAPPEKAAIRELAKKSKELGDRIRAAREAVREDPQLLVESELVNLRANELCKAARGASGVYWGTYLLVERAIEAAKKPKKQKGKPAMDPSFHRWSGEGRVGIQLHHDKFSDVLLGKSNMIRIDLTWERKKGVVRDRTRRGGTVKIRVGTDENRQPIWVELPILLDRMPPPDATLTWAWILARKRGAKVEYTLQLTVESPSFARVNMGKNVVAINIGWRVREAGIRVGYCRDDQGKAWELLLPHRDREAFERADAMRGYLDKQFNATRTVVSKKNELLPAWAEEEARFMHLWKTPYKLSLLAGKFAEEVLPNGGRDLYRAWTQGLLGVRTLAIVNGFLFGGFAAHEKVDLMGSFEDVAGWATLQGLDEQKALAFYLLVWKRKDAHVYQFASDMRATVSRRRRDQYRCWAAELSRHYQTIVLLKVDYRELRENAKPEEEQEPAERALHRLAHVAAPGELSRLIAERTHASMLPPEDKTRTCHDCLFVNQWEKPEVLIQTCAGCGKEFDQDDNNARNILAAYFERSGTDGSPGTGRGGGFSAPPDHGEHFEGASA